MAGSEGVSGWERLFWMVFENTSNAVLLLDTDRRIVELNEPAERMLGGDREQLIGRNLGDIVLASERSRSDAEWRAFLKSGEYTGVRDLIGLDGSSTRVEFAAQLVDVDGERRAIYVAMPAEEPVRGSPPPAQLPLTPREREIVSQIALGRDTTQIAQALHVSPETVRSHVRNAMGKLDVHTRAQLVAVVLCGKHGSDELQFAAQAAFTRPGD